MKPQFRGHRARRDVVRSAEGREEVVEGSFVGDIDGRELEAPFIFVVVEQIVVAEADVEEIAGSDAGRVVVVVLGAWGWREIRVEPYPDEHVVSGAPSVGRWL